MPAGQCRDDYLEVMIRYLDDRRARSNWFVFALVIETFISILQLDAALGILQRQILEHDICSQMIVDDNKMQF